MVLESACGSAKTSGPPSPHQVHISPAGSIASFARGVGGYVRTTGARRPENARKLKARTAKKAISRKDVESQARLTVLNESPPHHCEDVRNVVVRRTRPR